MNPIGKPGIVIVTGLSGSGKSVALRVLEDLNHYCIDNLPVRLLPHLLDSGNARNWPGGLAVSIDIRNADEIDSVPQWLAQTRARGFDCQLLFFEAGEDVLVRRYAETRRRHPLGIDGTPLRAAIARERARLAPLRADANHIIDSNGLNVHQLRRRVIETLQLQQRAGLGLMVESFAYRGGIPNDADFVFDARCLPNPHWDPQLRPLSGRDAEVARHLDAQPEARLYLEQIIALVESWLPTFAGSTRSYLTIAFGCSGGRHRSVWLAERLAAHFRAHGHPDIAVHHRELG